METSKQWQLFENGLIEQKDTWWGKKIIQYEKQVVSGKFGEVLKTWKEYSGWGDGIKLSYYWVLINNKPEKIYVNESGVFKCLESGGAVNINIDDHKYRKY